MRMAPTKAIALTIPQKTRMDFTFVFGLNSFRMQAMGRIPPKATPRVPPIIEK